MYWLYKTPNPAHTTHMDNLSYKMAELNIRKRSFVDAFLADQAADNTASKNSTRIELARAKNRRDREYQNMAKNKERARKMIEKLRESEAAYNAAEEEVQRLKELLRDDK